MFPLGQNIPDWVFAWNVALLCWRRMDSVWSHCVCPRRTQRVPVGPALVSHLVAPVCWADPEMGRQGVLGLGWPHQLPGLVQPGSGQAHHGPSRKPGSVPLGGGARGRALLVALLFPVKLGFASRSCVFIYLFKNHPKKIHPAMTNIWIKAKPDSFQGSWADHTYLGPIVFSQSHPNINSFFSYTSSLRNNSPFCHFHAYQLSSLSHILLSCLSLASPCYIQSQYYAF